MVEHSPRTEEESSWPVEPEQEPRRGGAHYLILLATWGALAVMGLLALIAEPDPRGVGTHEQLGLAPCRMMEWTGVPCPGCGVTTSLTHVLHGSPLEALAVQPFGLITAVALPLLALWALAVHLRGGDLYLTLARTRRTWLPALLLLMGASWIYKLFRVLG